MYTLVIGRAYPEESTGMMGIFEFEQAKALNRNGMRTIYAFCDNRSIKKLKKLGNFYAEDEIKAFGYNLPIGGLPTKIFNRFKSKLLKKIINEIISKYGKPNIIHVHFPLLTLTDELWSFLCELQIPLVITEHWTKVQTKKIDSTRKRLLKNILEESDKFICVGEPLKNSVLELTKLDKDIDVIPNMVSNKFLPTLNTSEKQKFKFVTVGRLVDVKRFSLVIDAFTEEFKNEGSVYLDIVGGGPLFKELQDKIADLNMEKRINLYGFLNRSEAAKRIQESDAFVSASVLETFGVPFIEAMACGKPVIGIKGGPIERYINDNNGILFEADDKADLKRILKKLYLNKNKYNGERISAEAKCLFSEEAVTQQLIEVYNRIDNWRS